MHWAVQPVASFGFTVLAPSDDFEHTTLSYADGILRTRPNDDGLRAAFAFEDASIRLLDAQGRTLDRVGIAGQTLDGLYQQLEGSGSASGVVRSSGHGAP